MKYLDVDGLGRVSRIGLGTWQFGSREWGYGDSYASGGARVIVERALELGVTLFDTAEAYGFGKSERILGEALGAARDDVVIASKIFPLAPFPPVIRQRAHGQRQAARRQQDLAVPGASAQPGGARLGHHAGDAQPARRRHDRRRGRLELLAEPLAKADAALGRPVISNQVHFSLANPAPLHDLVPFAEREGRIVMAYSPLEQGLLGGKYTVDNRPGGIRAVNPFFAKENLQRAEPLLEALRRIAAAHDAKPAQVALAWLLSLPERRRHPRGVQCRAARVQRFRRRPRARPGRRSPSSPPRPRPSPRCRPRAPW